MLTTVSVVDSTTKDKVTNFAFLKICNLIHTGFLLYLRRKIVQQPWVHVDPGESPNNLKSIFAFNLPFTMKHNIQAGIDTLGYQRFIQLPSY